MSDNISEKDIDEYLEKKIGASVYKEMKRNKRKNMFIGFLITLIFLMAAAFIVFLVLNKRKKEKEPEVTRDYIVTKLEDASDLTTQTMTIEGSIHYEDGDIPFINKKSYTMTYKATVSAGIDVKDIDVMVLDENVIVTLPEVEVYDPIVDTDSIEFHDESFALFNWDKKEDGVEAVKLAEDDVLSKDEINTLKGEAKTHAEELIKKLLEDAVGDKNLIVK